MAIVSIQEVTQSTGFDAVNDSLIGNESSYGYNFLKYPQDIGTPTKNHYVVFFINQQDKTQFGGSGTSPVEGVRPTAVQNRIDAGTASNPDAELNIAQATKRTSGAVCLYMPDTLAFDGNQSYSEIALGDSVAGAFASGAFSLADAARSEAAKKGVSNPMSSVLGGLADQVSKAASSAATSKGISGTEELRKAAMQAKIGIATNPMMELIYSKPEFRSFRFDFMFYPRNSKESEDAQKIVELFKFHFSPEILKSSNGYFLVPPSQFDIKFYYNGAENPNIEQTTTAVMTSISCDYAPNGWAAYELPGSPKPGLGATGSPVAIRLTMNFKEIEYKTKDHYKTGQYAFLGANWAKDYFGASAAPSDSSTPSTQQIDNFLNQVGFQG